MSCLKKSNHSNVYIIKLQKSLVLKRHIFSILLPCQANVGTAKLVVSSFFKYEDNYYFV